MAQTSLKGVVNQYVRVNRVVQCDSLVYVDDERGFSIGDRVMLVQTSGAVVDLSQKPQFGTLTDLEYAGAVDLLTVRSIAGTEIRFTSPPTFAYNTSSTVQLVKIAAYPSARIDADVIATPYDGKVGGIIAIECAGDLILNANIIADTAGYRGGEHSGEQTFCGDTSYFYILGSQRAGGKGESPSRSNGLSGRGRLYSGGGGGNAHNSGGAGGGNGGYGGHGGDAVNYCLDKADGRIDMGGVGGSTNALEYAQHRIFMGSGGGGGHENRLSETEAVYTGTSGGRGGGLIYIKANRIICNGGILRSNGMSVTKISGYDGAGGGGAGGTIVLDCPIVSDSLVCEARGGNGGSIGYTKELGLTYNGHGPGGGGGGGLIALLQPLQKLKAILPGGNSGIHIDKVNEAYMKSRNATNGDPGRIIDNFTWNVFKIPVVKAYGDSVICPGKASILYADTGYTKYVWSNGQTTRVISVTEEGPYSVVAYDSIGCPRYSNVVNVRWNPSIYSSPRGLDLGTGDIGEIINGATTLLNNDDEDITIVGVATAPPFFIEAPVAFPVVIPAGGKLSIRVGFVGLQPGDYKGDIHIAIGKPCESAFTATVTANVSPVYATLDAGEVTGQVGSKDVTVPIYARFTPDSLAIPNIDVHLVVSFDRRAYAPTGIINGRIVRDVINVTENRRSIAIDIVGATVGVGNYTTITSIVGVALSSSIEATSVTIDSVLWGAAARKPITTVIDGAVNIIPGCFASVRSVRFTDNAGVVVWPNPASSHLSVFAEGILPDTYVIQLNSVVGVPLLELVAEASEDQVLETVLTTADIPPGAYMLTIRSDVGTLATIPVAIVH